MKHSEILKAAKAQLWDGKDPTARLSRHICVALLDAAEELGGHFAYAAADRMRGIIMERLSGTQTLPRWLRIQHGVNPNDLTDERVQAHRHAWVDLLIAEHEAKGD